MAVDRCTCHEVTFASLVPIIETLRSDGITDEHLILEQLRIRTQCTSGCTMCEPYIRLTIKTGETSFSPIPIPITFDDIR